VCRSAARASRRRKSNRAIAFSKAWSSETSEDAEAKSFWDAFFMVFGVQRRTVASFEEPVKKLSGQWGYIDLFWPGTMLAEHKSAGKDLGKAHAQGMEYIRGLFLIFRDSMRALSRQFGLIGASIRHAH
jgi:hypothetical protein